MDFQYSFVINGLPDRNIANQIADQISNVLQSEFSTYIYVTPEEI